MHDKLLNDSPYQDRQFYNFATSSKLPRHRWYYFKEGFSSGLVEEAINLNGGSKKRLNIIDPFCGSGTTALTSALNGHNCITTEVNPFLAFIAKVKTRSGTWRRSNFLQKLEQIINSSEKGSYSRLESFSTFSKRPNLDKWIYNTSVIRSFTSILESIEQFGGSYQEAFKMAAIVASSECSNVIKDGKAVRYKKNWKELQYSDNDFIIKFRQISLMMLDDLERHPIKQEHTPKILSGDARNTLATLEDNNYDLIVTSPPYLNSFDYTDVYRPELFMGGFIKDNDELKKLRLQTLRSHVQVGWHRNIEYESIMLDPIVKKIEQTENLWNKNIPLMIRAYFDDMWKIFNDLSKKLKKNGEAWVVVSTSAYGGIEIPVDFILADAATNAGLILKEIHNLRQLRTSTQQWKQLSVNKPPLRESLIILKKM